ncbi:MAG: TolC family protein [Acidobacteriaceae bacterium]|nr:TolC family protein [Acidobacteriaceae bacterium]MBV9780691.1 TolC family protein [Acidobacteriaceae bacterium]
MRCRRRLLDVLRRHIALGLCFACAVPAGWAQQQSIAPEKAHAPYFLRPYLATDVPPIRLANSVRMRDLIRAGKLYLTAQDAVALALENNIDVEIARYNPLIDEWQLERAQAGGALPGVPSASSQVGSVSSGQGVAGSQAAAGINTGGQNGSNGARANATISQIGPVTPTLDAVIQDTSVFSHVSAPQVDPVQSLVPNLISNSRTYNFSVNQGFLTGGSATVTYHESYLNENTPTDILNPSVAPYLQFSIQHNFLSGFGVGVNSRTISVARNNLKSADVTFKGQLIGIVVNALNLYYGLAADYEDLKAKQSALVVAQQFYQNNKKQVELGTMAPLDVTTAQAQVASTQQDLVISQTTLQQQEVQLKNVLSRTGLADPLWREVQIIPIDRIVVPEKDNLPPLKELVARALASRTDIALEKVNLANSEVSTLGTKSGVLPLLEGLATLRQAGVAGPTNPIGIVPADTYFIGGMRNALGQVFRRDFPTENAGAFFSATLRNQTAQADYAIDQFQLRQSQLQNQKDLNQIVVDVSNGAIELQQARVRYEAAVKNRVLEEQLLDAEQKRFSLGASTTFNVVTQQRDLATAQSNEVAALVSYSNARVALDQVIGATLDENHISVQEALSGRLARQSVVPASLPSQP